MFKKVDSMFKPVNAALNFIRKAPPLRKSVPSLVNPAASVRRVRDLYWHVRALRAGRRRVPLNQIPVDDRPFIARGYRLGAFVYALFGLALGAGALAFGQALPAFAVWVLAICVPAYLFIAILRLWQAAMVEQARPLSLTKFILTGQCVPIDRDATDGRP